MLADVTGVGAKEEGTALPVALALTSGATAATLTPAGGIGDSSGRLRFRASSPTPPPAATPTLEGLRAASELGLAALGSGAVVAAEGGAKDFVAAIVGEGLAVAAAAAGAAAGGGTKRTGFCPPNSILRSSSSSAPDSASPESRAATAAVDEDSEDEDEDEDELDMEVEKEGTGGS